jgi:hypothetical protein
MASHGLLAVMLSGELNSGAPRARRRAAIAKRAQTPLKRVGEWMRRRSRH